ncbi:protein HEADING DATE REPRESSOR [Salix suchowensis]|nr:protein HEADING DATE REPRESSOR [Salix suchowensis]
MEKEDSNKTRDARMVEVELLNGFSPVSSARIFWKSRKGSASRRNLDKVTEDNANETPNKQKESCNDEKMLDQNLAPELSERRKALFEPLEPVTDINGKSYPKGWLIGKKRKLVNVDVVESMRRIAVQEMNRKDREINGLNEQLEEDARCLEHLQLQLLQEKSRRAEVEREKAMLKDQISMLMNMLQENEPMGDEDLGSEGPDEP